MSAMSSPSPRHPSRGRLLHATVVSLSVLVAAALVVTGVHFFGPDTERQAVHRLPKAERRALYERTLRTLEASCVPVARSPGLDDFCREQAEFLLNFPECDAACRTRAVRFYPPPTR
jgi:cytochrome b pre-mRNA-processing protein 3